MLKPDGRWRKVVAAFGVGGIRWLMIVLERVVYVITGGW
jgi:hypothetical protein